MTYSDPELGPHTTGPELVHHRVSDHARLRPDAVAITYEGHHLSYAELEDRSDRVCRNLQRRGVRQDEVVGLCTERSPEMVVGMLGILKSGAAYLPLNADYPSDRLAYILNDAGCDWVLTQESVAHRLAGARSRRITLDSREIIAADVPHQGHGRRVYGDNLAYVLYTSGSTGLPKGVGVTHGNLARLLRATQFLECTAADGVLQLAPLSFGACVFEVWLALAGGARLVLFPNRQFSIELLQQTVENEGVTILHLPAGVFANVVDQIPTTLSKARHILTGGDVVPAQAIRRAASRLTECQLTVCYGCSENTVFSTLHRVTGAPTADSVAPIGQAIDGSQAYVVDDQIRLSARNASGEICVSGDGLARGYVSRPGLTAERFIANPFRADGSRMLRTGDLGRARDGGHIDFMGRSDLQVKIRGFRVEPAEVEAHLAQCEGVRRAVVIAKEGSEPGQTRLLAYVQPAARVELWPSIAEHWVYDDFAYGAMAAHNTRNQAFAAAFQRRLRNATVLEIGPGPEAVLARLALESGARKVFAVEFLEESYLKARATVARLGLAGRIELLRGDAREIELPEKVDFCISEIVGNIGGSEGAACIINSVRRWLKHAANFIPQRSVTMIAAVSLTEDLFDYAFNEVAASYVERIFANLGGGRDIRVCLGNLPENSFLSTAGIFEDLDFTAPLASCSEHSISLELVRPGLFTGFVVWLVLHLDEQSVLDSRSNPGSWLPVYFPIADPGIAVNPGDRFIGVVTRTLSQDNVHPDFTLRGVLMHGDGRQQTVFYASPHSPVQFKGSRFYAKLFADENVAVCERVSATALRRQLLQRLPDYMVPSSFTLVDSFPLTANGKVDRASLPAPDRSSLVSHDFAAPIGEVETALARIWQDLLGVERVGRHDNFIELGGHSLLALALVKRARAASLALTFEAVFRANSLAELAQVIRPTPPLGREPPVGPV